MARYAVAGLALATPSFYELAALPNDASWLTALDGSSNAR